MTNTPLLSMVMIARDEEENIEPCFASFWAHVDEVVLVDTGSGDGTVAAAKAFAESRGEPDKLTLGRFEWCDDFAKARNYADSLATGEWLCVCDLDDRTIGGENLRGLCAAAEDWVEGFMFEWRLGPDPHPPHGRRDRIMRRTAYQPWKYRVHEARTIDSARTVLVDPDVAHWLHVGLRVNGAAYRRTLEAWFEEEPDEVWVLGYLAVDCAMKGQAERAVTLLRRWLAHPDATAVSQRQSFWRLLVLSLRACDLADDATAAAEAAFEEFRWPHAHTSMAEVCIEREDWEEALSHADWTLRLAPLMDEDWHVISSWDYEVTPYMLKARALLNLDRVDEALRMAREAETRAYNGALRRPPGHPAQDAKADEAAAVALIKTAVASLMLDVARERLQDGDFAGALGLANDSLDRVETSDAFRLKAAALIALGEIDKGIRSVTRAAALAPDDDELTALVAHLRELRAKASDSTGGRVAALLSGGLPNEED